MHGLNPFSHANHAYDTWTHQNGTFWLYHFLPSDIPEARIWVYGYNSNVAKDVSEARIKDHADVLLDRLQRKRKEGRVSPDFLRCLFVSIHSICRLLMSYALKPYISCILTTSGPNNVLETWHHPHNIYRSQPRRTCYQAGKKWVFARIIMGTRKAGIQTSF